jgi:WD40 repeat protein
VLSGHDGGVRLLHLTPDGRRAVTAGRDMTIRVWDVDKGIRLQVMEGHRHAVGALALSPDGRFAVSVADDMSCRVWDLCSGAELAMYVHPDNLCSLWCILSDDRFACGTSHGEVHFLHPAAYARQQILPVRELRRGCPIPRPRPRLRSIGELAHSLAQLGGVRMRRDHWA